MIKNNEKTELLCKEIKHFVENIDLYLNDNLINENKVLLIGDYGIEGFSRYEDNPGIVSKYILLDKRNIKIRYDFISDEILKKTKYSKNEILKCIYKHILFHEYYHYKNDNVKAFNLNKKYRYKDITEEEKNIIREEERNSEIYALNKSLKEYDRFQLYFSLLLDINIFDKINIDITNNKDDLHMSNEERFLYIGSKSFTDEQNKIIEQLINS